MNAVHSDVMVLKFVCIFLFLVSGSSPHWLGHAKKKVCPSFRAYFVDYKRQCFRNEDVGADLPELVTQNNYPLETHEVTTKDGYQLTLFRLPNNPTSKGAVFLQHPALSTCTVYLDKGNRSLGYILYNEGYDVWLGNSRGTFYSQTHKTLDPKFKDYWDFSYHEMGMYDLPASFDYIKKKTGVKDVAFIGHSMAGATAAVYSSLKPEHAKTSIKVLILMAPGIFLRPISTPVKHLVPFRDLIYKILNVARMFKLFSHEKCRDILRFCYEIPFLTKPCALGMQLLMGANHEQIEPLFVPLLFSQAPAELSLKTLHHLAQNVASGGKFKRYDYGLERNLQKYRSQQPPDYPVKRITVPLYLLSGTADAMTSREGIDSFYNSVSTKPENLYGHITIDKFNHVDFLYAKEAHSKVYTKILEVLDTVFKN